jgi:F-type H+-transporting ATPase subunit epsilon
MAETFVLEIVTPYQQIVNEEVEEFTAPGPDGEFGILPSHAPFFTTLKTGKLSYKKDGVIKYLAVSGGFAEVVYDRTTVLAEFAERAEDIDIENAESDVAELEKKLEGIDENDKAYAEVEHSLERAQLRVSVSKGEQS